MLALPIFPCSHPQSIFGADELNFCVRDGNRWTLAAINTNSLFLKRKVSKRNSLLSSPYRSFLGKLFTFLQRQLYYQKPLRLSSTFSFLPLFLSPDKAQLWPEEKMEGAERSFRRQAETERRELHFDW